MEAALAEWVRCRLFMVDPELTYNDKKLYSYRDAVRKIAGDKVIAIYAMLFDCEAEVYRMFVFTPENGPNELATPWIST